MFTEYSSLKSLDGISEKLLLFKSMWKGDIYAYM